MWNGRAIWACGLMLSLISTMFAQQNAIRIKAPAQDERVPERPFVEGSVSDVKATVWVIVHPMDVSDYWVQPAVSVRESSTWKVKIYVGRPGAQDKGKHFEIKAVANPRVQLREGQVIDAWPEAQSESQVIEVVRE